MHVYRNDVPAQNEAPTVPTGLAAEMQSENGVLFLWIPSTDDHTAAPAITYDLVVVRVGTHTPMNGGINTFLARLPEPGNISAVTEWALTGLENGEYQWQLRAVDAAYAGSETASGMFNIGLVSLGEPEDNLPHEYAIEQNYPNPFNPSTAIRYSIPQAGLVSLKLYNLLGEEVNTLVNELKQPGYYTVIFEGSSLSSGVYFYRIQAQWFH